MAIKNVLKKYSVPDHSVFSIRNVKKTLDKKISIHAKAAGVDEENRIVSGWGSWEQVDRYGDLMLATAFEKHLPTFMLNPVMMWAHSHSVPSIGHYENVEIFEGQGLKFDGYFANTEKANEIFELYRDKHLQAFSVSFIPKISRDATDDEKEKYGPELKLVLEEVELLEISPVNVPAVPLALADRIGVKSFQDEGFMTLLKDVYENVEILADERIGNVKIYSDRIKNIVVSLARETDKFGSDEFAIGAVQNLSNEIGEIAGVLSAEVDGVKMVKAIKPVVINNTVISKSDDGEMDELDKVLAGIKQVTDIVSKEV